MKIPHADQSTNTPTAQTASNPTDQQKADLIQQNAAAYRALAVQIDADYAQALDELRWLQQHGPVEAVPAGVVANVTHGGDLLWERIPLALTPAECSLAGVWCEFARLCNSIDPPISAEVAAATHAAVRELPTPPTGPAPGATLARAAARAFIGLHEAQRAVVVDPSTGLMRSPSEIALEMLQWQADGSAFDKFRSALALIAATYDPGTDPGWAFNDAVRRMLAQLDHVTPRGAQCSSQAVH